MSVLRNRHGGWSNDKPWVRTFRLAETAGNDPTAVGATAALTGAALVSALVIPKPKGLAVAAVALATIGFAWRHRLRHQPVSLLIERARWEQFQQDVTTAGDVKVDVGRLARAIDKNGTVYDVLLTCQRRDLGVLRDALRMDPEISRSEA